MSENEEDVKEKAIRHRSPGFPVLPIDDAIARLRLIFRQDKRAYTTAQAILSHLGFKSAKRSGQAGRVISALKQYGLLDEEKGKFRVSDTGFRILHLPEESEERKRLIADAAMLPPIFSKILAYYSGELPSDEALSSHLILNEEFNPDSVEHFIHVLRRTIEIANPSRDDYTVGEEYEGAEPPPAGATPMQQPPRGNQGQGVAQQPPTRIKEQSIPSDQQAEQKTLFNYNVPLSIQRDVNAHLVITGSSLKKRDLDVLAKKVKDLLDAFEEEEIETEQPNSRRPEPMLASQGDSDDLDEAFRKVE
jgi:hypothetical protein